MNSENDYDAFISYRTSVSLDKSIAVELQRMLETFPVPSPLKEGLARPERRRHRLQVFRDTTDLPATHDLDAALQEKLERSRFLIIVCTPDYLDSTHCSTELQVFRETHDEECIIVILARGEPEHSIPPDLTTKTIQPLWIDVRADSINGAKGRLKGRGLSRAERPYFKILAVLLNCETPDALVRRDRERFWRDFRRRVLLAAILAVVVIGPKLAFDYCTFQLTFSNARFDGDPREVLLERKFDPFSAPYGTQVFEHQLLNVDCQNMVEGRARLSVGRWPDWQAFEKIMNTSRLAISRVEIGSDDAFDLRPCVDEKNPDLVFWSQVDAAVAEQLKGIMQDSDENWIRRVRAEETLKAADINVALDFSSAKEKDEYQRYQMSKMSQAIGRMGNPFGGIIKSQVVADKVESAFRFEEIASDRLPIARKFVQTLLSKSSGSSKLDVPSELLMSDIDAVMSVLCRFSIYTDQRIRINAIRSMGKLGQQITLYSDETQLVEKLTHHDSSVRRRSSIVLGFRDVLTQDTHSSLDRLLADTRPWVRQAVKHVELYYKMRQN